MGGGGGGKGVYIPIATLSRPEWFLHYDGQRWEPFQCFSRKRWAKSQDSVHKPQPFWRERKAEAVSNRGPSASQPNTLPLGQTGSQYHSWCGASCPRMSGWHDIFNIVFSFRTLKCVVGICFCRANKLRSREPNTCSFLIGQIRTRGHEAETDSVRWRTPVASWGKQT